MADDTIDAIGSIDSQSSQWNAGALQNTAPVKETSPSPEPAGGGAPASEPQSRIDTADNISFSRELMDEKNTGAQSRTAAADQPGGGITDQNDTRKASEGNNRKTDESPREGYGSKIIKFAQDKAENASVKDALKGALKIIVGSKLSKLAGGPAGIAYDILGNAKKTNSGEARDMAKWYTDKGMQVPQLVQDWVNREKGN